MPIPQGGVDDARRQKAGQLIIVCQFSAGQFNRVRRPLFFFAKQGNGLAAVFQQHGPIFRGHKNFPGFVVKLGDFQVIPVAGHANQRETQQNHEDRGNQQGLNQSKPSAPFAVSILFHDPTPCRAVFLAVFPPWLPQMIALHPYLETE